jgi:hypothetical protein
MKKLLQLTAWLGILSIAALFTPRKGSFAVPRPMPLGAAVVASGPVHPSVVLTCTAPGTMPTGAAFYFFRAQASGAEGTTPINATGQASCGYTDLAVLVNNQYCYVVKVCATSLATGTLVCGSPSNEATAIGPLLPSDLPTASGLTALGN